MKKRLYCTRKVVSFLLVFILLVQAMETPLEALGAEITELISSVTEAGGASPPSKPPSDSGVSGIAPPAANENPNILRTNSFLLPVYNERLYLTESLSRRSFVNHYERTPEKSAYYTTSVLVLTDYQNRSAGTVSGSLPYVEERDKMFHMGLTLDSLDKDSRGCMEGTLTTKMLEKLVPNGTSLWDYLDPDQLQLRVEGELQMGYGNMRVRVRYPSESGISNKGFAAYFDKYVYNSSRGGMVLQELGKNGLSKVHRFNLTVPYDDRVEKVDIEYTVEPGSILSKPNAVLYDNQAPYIKDVQVHMEVNEQSDESALIMTVSFNEGIRYVNTSWTLEHANDCYITANLWNSTSGKKQSVRLYLDQVDGGKTVTFRGDLGKLHYCNFELTGFSPNRVSDIDYRSGTEFAALDLADRFVLRPGAVIEYGNAPQINRTSVSFSAADSLNLCDHAGNAVSFSMNTWSQQASRIFTHRTDVVEADRISLYTDKTLGVEMGEIDVTQAVAEDMIVGPGRDLTAFVYLSRVIEDEKIWKDIYIELNVLDKDGKPVRAYPTSATKYTESELYADGDKTGTVLRYENIRFSQDMSLGVAEGTDIEPLVWVNALGSRYDPEATEYPTVYPYVNAPDTTIYGDFTPPEVSVRKITDGELTASDEEGTTYKRFSLEVSIDEVIRYNRSAGLLGEQARITLSGGVECETPILYYISTEPTASDDPAAYKTSAVLAPNTTVMLGGFTMMNDSVKMYVHVLTESGKGTLYLDNLFVGVDAQDLSGNRINVTPPYEVEYYIDEIVPTASILGQSVSTADNNTTLLLNVDISASDHSRIDRLLYFFGSELPKEGDTDTWKLAVIEEFGSTVRATVQKKYGEPNGTPLDQTVFTEYLWVKAVDTYGNESEPAATFIQLSMQKPATHVTYNGDPTQVSTAHRILVSGPEKSLLGATGYTRVTLTPRRDPTYSYVTVIESGQENVDVLALTGLTWYRVKIDQNAYTEVSAPAKVGEDPNGILDSLIEYYGELKVSFENGYGDTNSGKTMTPAVGAFYTGAATASYYSDPNYYVVRFASPLLADGDLDVHNVDFGAVMDYAIPYDPTGVVIVTDGTVVMPDADIGAAPYVFNQKYKGVNPMRQAQIHYSITNIADPSYGLLDLDYANSYAELLRVKEGTETEDTVVAKQNGLWATGNQYFTIQNEMDNGEYFVSGAYYLRVTLVSTSGHTDSFESAKVILDAQTADTAGMWSYNYKTVGSLTLGEERYQQITKDADGKAFEDIGITVMADGEVARSRYFATYSFGTKDLEITLSTPDSTRTYEGVTVGEVEGYKLWNILSEPTQNELDAKRFELSPIDGTYGSPLTDTLVRKAKTSTIYTSENIPKGIAGFNGLFLVKGTNTFCYQVKMKNGYVSPVRYFTITVSDEAPDLSIIVDGYQPSLEPSQTDGVINADHIRYMVDDAYSINGSGRVEVDLWGQYIMTLGLFDEETGELEETQSLDPTGSLARIHAGMKTGEYAIFTENTYTGKFPSNDNYWCTGVFVATDEYGGVTMVAPQLGDLERINVDEGVIPFGHEIRISYAGSYFDDPYTVGDSQFRFRIFYNQPQYFGAQLLSLDTYLVEKNENDEEIRVKDIQIADPALRYNMFNIRTNDIRMLDGQMDTHTDLKSYERVTFQNGREDDPYKVGTQQIYTGNQQLIQLPKATVTFSGGFLTNPVTVDFTTGNLVVNGERTDTPSHIGYLYGASNRDSSTGDYTELAFSMANPPADAQHPAGTTTKLTYILEYGNAYGDTYTKTGEITLTYMTYQVSDVTMTEYGAELSYNFEVYDPTGAGLDRTGNFQNGTYSIKVPDYFGGVQEFSYEITDQADPNTAITYTPFQNTAKPVTVTLTSTTGKNITVDVTDYEIMKVEHNNTTAVTVTVYRNTRFSYRYVDDGKGETTYCIDVNNIYVPEPQTIFSVDLSDEDAYNVDEDGTKYRYGSVTVYLMDSNFILEDLYTGRLPSFTFVPGGSQVYTFKAADIQATIGSDTIALPQDVTVRLDVELREVPTYGFSTDDDVDSPNVQVQAYAKQGEAYLNQKMAMQLLSIRNINPLSSHFDHQVFSYVGNRANMTEVLNRMGWSTAYRFTLETVDASRTKIFIKQGLYAEAPDFATGLSDTIPGVELNSKLLTVNKNAKFTVFVVDSFNNYASIAFNITNISAAPVPSVVKVPLSHNQVRVYLIPPEGVADVELKIESPLSDLIETNPDSEYFGRKYVDFQTNDDHKILYSITYKGIPVRDELDVSVSEISLDEMRVLEQNWSSNKMSEATASIVSANLRFSHTVKEIEALTTYDAELVTFEVQGNAIYVEYTDNHAPIGLRITAENGTYVTVNLDAVTNIDHAAPEVRIISEELAPSGRSLILTLATNERTTFREGGGRMGESTVVDGVTCFCYTIQITENGVHTFTFLDLSGQQTVFTYELDTLVFSAPDILYNTAPDEAGAQNAPELLNLRTGATVYIKPNRDVTATLSKMADPLTIPAGEWFELVIPESVGGIPPYIIYTDAYGNVVTHQFAEIEVPDQTPPEIVISKKTYPVREGTDRALVEQELLMNFVAFDDRGGEVTRTVEFTENLNSIGVTTVTYRATDSEGNVAEAHGKLRITSIYEPVVSIGEKRVITDEGVNLKSGENVSFHINSAGINYKLILASGKRTAAQLKGWDATYEGTAETVDLGALDDGFYTVLIVTDQRDYFRVFISIEKF